MKDCSVVTATYDLGEGVKGTIGIVGPKRMDYEKVMDNLNDFETSLMEFTISRMKKHRKVVRNARGNKKKQSTMRLQKLKQKK